MALRLTTIALLLISAAICFAQGNTSEQSKILVVYDSSNSMWGELTDGSRKYEVGRRALGEFLQQDLGGRSIGLRPYGHRETDNCRDTELLVPFGNRQDAQADFVRAVAGIRPTGKTPITYSLRQGLSDLGESGGDILLISDGIETCDIDPCELMRQWRAENVAIRVHVVGVGLNELERGAMSCIADTSGGQYFDADSTAGFEEALADAGAALEEPAEPDPRPASGHYALIIVATDASGRSYIVKGTATPAVGEASDVWSSRRNVLANSGEYVLHAGPILKDGTIYKPVSKAFTVSSLGETRVEIEVEAPASVGATFTELGVEHRGSVVTAYQNGVEAFKFRASDEVLARPGEYRFEATPNQDNELSLDATLTAATHTQLQFELTKTVQYLITYKLPNGETFTTNSYLYRDGEKIYGQNSRNPGTAIPGVYELRSGDQNLPVQIDEFTIPPEGGELEVALDAGWVVIRYAESEHYVKRPNRAWLHSLDRSGSKYARPDVPIRVMPGEYAIQPHAAGGYFSSERYPVTVPSNETVEIVISPEEVGQIVVTYNPDATYPKTPDRASVYAEEGQRVIKSYMTPGKPQKFLPGQYRVVGYRSSGDFDPVLVDVKAGETTTVELTPKQLQ